MKIRFCTIVFKNEFFNSLTGQEEQIGGFDLIYKGGPVKLPPNSTYHTLLGTYNNRSQQLKKLAKSTAMRLAQVQLNSETSLKTPKDNPSTPTTADSSFKSKTSTTASTSLKPNVEIKK